MKRTAALALLGMLLLTACLAGGEETGGQEAYARIDGETVTAQEEEALRDAAILRFSSFSGGGYEYSAAADDPSVVRCETRYEYEPHAEEIDGAAFDFFVTLTGLKAGSTVVRVYGRSPIQENETSVYTVTVDENLRVSLTPVRAISFFYVYRSGEIHYDSYQITLDAEGYRLSVSEGPERPIGADRVSALMKVIDDCDLASWDGFSGSQPFVLDGESFWLDFTLTDGTRVHASGDNVFPEHYFEAMGEIWKILIQIQEEAAL